MARLPSLGLTFLSLSCVSVAACSGGEQQRPAAHASSESAGRFFPRGEGAALGLDPAALSALVGAAEKSHSDALILIKDGRVVVEEYFGHRPRPISIMSITKGIVSLAIGALIDEKKIPSVDAPLSTWFPEWGEGPKAKVTLRHVLTHSSGLEHQGPAKLYAQPDRLAYVRQLPLVESPGQRVSYNNEAVELLSGIVRIAAGKPLDVYVKEKFFAPMDIVDFSWDKDSAGNVQTYADLSLSARDLAKIGQWMLDGGRWNGKQLVSSTWIAQSTSPARADSSIGLLWWVKYTWERYTQSAEAREGFGKLGFAAANKLAPLDGRPFGDADGYFLAVTSLLTNEEMASFMRIRALPDRPVMPDGRRGDPIGFSHTGSNGQSLVVYRPWHLVAVRLHDAEGEQVETMAQYMAEQKEHGFLDFDEAVRATVRK